MEKKNKVINCNKIEFVSSDEENAIYRVAVPSSKIISIKERHKILKSVSETTVHFFDKEDLMKLKKIEAQLHDQYNNEDKKDKSNIFKYLYNILDI